MRSDIFTHSLTNNPKVLRSDALSSSEASPPVFLFSHTQLTDWVHETTAYYQLIPLALTLWMVDQLDCLYPNNVSSRQQEQAL